MTTRLGIKAASWGPLALAAILVACANGGVLDNGSSDPTSGGPGTGNDSGATPGGDDSGSYTGYDSSPPAQDAGNPQPQDSGNPPPQDSGNPPPQDAAPPPQDAAPPPQDSGNPPPQDSGPVCNKPSGNPCVLTSPQCGCAANQKCDIDPNKPNVDVCVNTTKSGTQGSACSQYPDCSPGFACICTSSDPIFGCLATECEAWCIIGGANTCTNGTTCKALGSTITLGGQNFGTCQ